MRHGCDVYRFGLGVTNLFGSAPILISLMIVLRELKREKAAGVNAEKSEIRNDAEQS